MDIYLLLSIVVLGITLFSAYTLFNDLPGLDQPTKAGRRSRRP